MATSTKMDADRVARILALKAKYGGNGTSGTKSQGQSAGNGNRRTTIPDGSAAEEVRGVEAHPTNGEADRGEVDAAAMVSTEDIDDFDGIEIADDEDEGDSDLRVKPKWSGRHQPGYYRRRRGRLLAKVLRVEFDPAYITATTQEKALAAGIYAERGGYKYNQVAQFYDRILNSAEYVSRRKQALESFESHMDVPTAICLAEAAKRDPQYAVLRRRLRQMDEKRRIGGDQRDQFGALMGFLKGETDAAPEPKQDEGITGELDGDNREDTDGDISGEADPIPIRLEPARSAVSGSIGQGDEDEGAEQ